MKTLEKYALENVSGGWMSSIKQKSLFNIVFLIAYSCREEIPPLCRTRVRWPRLYNWTKLHNSTGTYTMLCYGGRFKY